MLPWKRAVRSLVPSAAILYRASTAHPQVALTFDDGPTPALTPRIVAHLQDRGHTGTFFAIGNRVAKSGHVLHEAVEAGCEVGVHSYNHIDFSKLPPHLILEEIEQTDAELRKLGVRPCGYVRPPYGSLSACALWLMHREGWGAPVLWSKSAVREHRRSAAEIVEALRLSNLQSGDIILLHDDHAETARAMPAILDLLEGRGLRSVTLSMLLDGAGQTRKTSARTPTLGQAMTAGRVRPAAPRG